jgi:dynein heavy chain, axonemal
VGSLIITGHSGRDRWRVDATRERLPPGHQRQSLKRNMSFQARHRWVISKLKWALDIESEGFVEESLRDGDNLEQLNTLFKHEGPRRLFFFYQVREVQNEHGEWGSTSSMMELYATNGMHEPLRGRAVWFLRKQGSVDLDLSKTQDGMLTFGTIDGSVLNSVENVMFKCYTPFLETKSQWGKNTSQQTKDFLSGTNRFLKILQSSLKTMTAGLELRKPDERFDLDARSKLSSNDWEMVAHFVELLEDWCKETEVYLDDNAGRQWETQDAGPDTELEYWRRRMQRLTSITEQLKTKECKTVIGVLSAVTKANQADMRVDRQRLFGLLRRWRQIDINITEAANEAKDNVKYLQTLEKFIDPLYNGTPQVVVDALPALLNSIKMIHTIARYYNTTERMTGLFMKITNQMITNCKRHITDDGDLITEKLWDADPEQMLEKLEGCLHLNEAYQEQYRITKDKLLTMPKGKQFDFSETQMFSKFDLFCRRIIKLIDMFSTVHQFKSLASHRLEGMDGLITTFHLIIDEFRNKKHDLLDYHNNKFDRDYVEFNVHIADLEGSLQQFINQSFENITSIEQSLALLKQFQTILQRESLKNDLDSKFTVIFHNYGLDLTTVQEIYEKYKHNPPIPRNMPPVAGNIMWSRHLLKRIEEPMRRFESNPTVLATKDSRKIIKTYNKVARTLVAFEYLWYEAWCRSVESAKAGLQATLIIRHPDTKKLYVNFDPEILQLIREGKCLSRIGIDIPESARIVLLQEDKFKGYYNDLSYLLDEYERIIGKMLPVTQKLMQPHVADLDFKLRPGMITLTWTSMNIDAYKHHAIAGMQKMEQLIANVNDIIENRISKNLKLVTRTCLVNLPLDKGVALDEFVTMQERHVKVHTAMLEAKNREIESAVDNIIELIRAYDISPQLDSVSELEVATLHRHYNNMMYTALLNSAKNSLNNLKARICARAGSGFLFVERPFFEVDVQLAVPSVRLSPSLDDIQRAVNKGALAVLRVTKSIWEWGQAEVPDEERIPFFVRIGEDVEIVKVVLLLTGALFGTRNQVHDYLLRFREYDWLWKDDMELAYRKFMMKKPAIEDFESELKRFMGVEADIEAIAPMHILGALSLNTKNIKLQLRNECRQWKVQYSDKVHHQARERMLALQEYIRKTTNSLAREVVDLESLRRIMRVLKEVRERESSIEMEIGPILDMYALLEMYLPGGIVDKEEMDKKSIIRSNWRKLSDFAEEVSDNLSAIQGSFKKTLIQDVRDFKDDVRSFRQRYVQNGPGVPGINAREAVVRLKRFKDEYEILDRKREVFAGGEDLFAIRRTDYSDLAKTKKELSLLSMLYSLYTDVGDSLKTYKGYVWAEVTERVDAMSETVAAFEARCKKLPRSLRDWDAFSDLSQQIEDFLNVLPLIQELSKDSIQNRHWAEVMAATGTTFHVDPNELKLKTLLDANMLKVKEEIEEICDSADKQMQINVKMIDVKGKWSVESFGFTEWKSKKVPVLKGYGQVIEDLDESQLALQTMMSMRHVGPFKDKIAGMLGMLSDTADTLELWIKVQLLWQSLESVFTGGDIMKQMPVEAKKFSKIDKDWAKVMAKAAETSNVVSCCANELLKNQLPIMYAELEKCQKALDGYLEQKRSKFPRFYFCSNSVLLQVLSRGSDPQAVQVYYEKLFDSVDRVIHDEKKKNDILELVNTSGVDEERIHLLKAVSATGNIEDWLGKLLSRMQETMKDLAEQACEDSMEMELRQFVDKYPAQFALLGVQVNWTAQCVEALERCRTSKSSMQDNNKAQLGILSELSSWTLDDLGTKMNRRKIETLITIQVHQRDVFSELTKLYKERKVSSPTDFEWLKQARFYFNPDVSDKLGDGACIISICDVDFHYNHEYLGCKERLVITPLTDRAYITLSQALGMCLGGAPAGPAGTGKTETVKDLGRALGLYVVVTNCTDNHSYTDMAKIFKGLCQAGLWGCFDEFNRIRLPVLSVVAQQVLAITNAKRTSTRTFTFPGDSANIVMDPMVGYFITMNPGYQGRQELPENLKVLFRSVSMMVPDREIIIRVKLCSVGYSRFSELAKKFRVLYRLCEEQLSKQRHYDFGLRNILSVLRTAGKVKRDNVDQDEALLMMGTLRDMNLSKMVSQDTPLFLSLLADLFPGMEPPKGNAGGDELQSALVDTISMKGLVLHKPWLAKVQQLYDTYLVRHGIMLVGPAGGGKSAIISTLSSSLAKINHVPFKVISMNPKAIQADEMFGETDLLSGEWMDGVFAMMWTKFNQRTNKFHSWVVCDGPVDAIWIENLNTVLDDNKLLTLANGDRIPMTDNVKLMFEVEDLNNASPATVSRVGIIYVSQDDLDWWPYAQAWIAKRPETEQAPLTQFFLTIVGTGGEGEGFAFIRTQCEEVVNTTRIGIISGACALLDALLNQARLSVAPSDMELEIERLFLYTMAWTLGGRLDNDDRERLDQYLRSVSQEMPKVEAKGDTIYDFFVDPESITWQKWQAPEWKYPSWQGDNLDFSNLLIPTLDSTRSEYILARLHDQKYPSLMVGEGGTAKTVTALMFFEKFDAGNRKLKKVNFSSATTGGMFQSSIEGELDKRGGKTYGPPNGKQMTVFLDDLNMPEVNEWSNQPTLECVRQLVATNSVCFLDKDKRGDLKYVEDLTYVAAANTPAGGKNDLPNRLKKLFFIFNMTVPTTASIDDIYGQMLGGRFGQASGAVEGVKGKKGSKKSSSSVNDAAKKLTSATISLWAWVKKSFLPTPAKFFYIFNMRDLSRIFQGVLRCPTTLVSNQKYLLQLWHHEAERVFSDKLTDIADKNKFKKQLNEITNKSFGSGTSENIKVKDEFPLFVDFLREDEFDEDGILVTQAPRVYELGGGVAYIRPITQKFLTEHNEQKPSDRMELVLFDDALKHMLRVSRIIGMDRGNALLVGVGGSGKRSSTKLAAYIARQDIFQITLTKSYNVSSLMEDMRELFKVAGQQGKGITWVFTDGDIVSEEFLEYINSILMTGEVAGLFPKDELNLMVADLRASFAKERPDSADNTENLVKYFVDVVRKNLHMVLCMSPMNPNFAERARKFPGLINGTTIDFFLPWPKEALVGVASGFISNFSELECDEKTLKQLTEHMGTTHSTVVETCADYFQKMRRHVHQTPKAFLSYLALYKSIYTKKLETVKTKESRVKLGLDKLLKGAADVEKMKVELAAQEEVLKESDKECSAMLGTLQVSSLEAKKESEAVGLIRDSCEAESKTIEEEKKACQIDLDKAQPFLDEAERAVNSIKPADLNELKKLPKPSDIIKLVFDCVSILRMQPMAKVEKAPVTMGVGKDKETFMFLQNSYTIIKAGMLTDANFLKSLFYFSQHEKDNMNEETMELLAPYLELEAFLPSVARNASQAAEGLCSWVRAMSMYNHASKVVKPKLESLAIASSKLDHANKELAKATGRLDKCKAKLDALQQQFENKMAEKQAIEDNATKTRKKMEMATQLIEGLSGERQRWKDDSKKFADEIRRLVGDSASASAFLSYCGPFNQPFRDMIVKGKVSMDLHKRSIPSTEALNLKTFLVDQGMVGEWNVQGLPTDSLSIDNGVLVTQATRFPLLIDPQGQGIDWIMRREEDRMPSFGATTLANPRLKDQIEQTLSEGQALIITGLDEDLDPMLDPILEKHIVKKARSLYISVGDKLCEYDPAFKMYLSTRLPNPHFSPEIQARATVVDFTVTLLGLEEQLLGRVIKKEQQILEDQLNEVLASVASNTKALLLLDEQLLQRLTANKGNLLDDVELIEVLGETKKKSMEVNKKLVAAKETKIAINEKREQYRAVATRASVLYFSVVDMSAVNNMYLTSLTQFIEIFNKSMDTSEKSSLSSKRVTNIIETMTYDVYRYMNRCMYGQDRLGYILASACKMLVTAKVLAQNEIMILLKGGAALDAATTKPRPFEWIETNTWLNVVNLSEECPFFASLCDDMTRNEAQWRHWCEENEPERLDPPDIGARFSSEGHSRGSFLRLLLVRSVRPDRFILAALDFVRKLDEIEVKGSSTKLPALGPKYVDPQTDTMEEVFASTTWSSPVIFLLSAGSDPTEDVYAFARKQKTSVGTVSLGEGQEPYALKAISSASVGGTWVLLQNCHLGLDFVNTLEDVLVRLKKADGNTNDAFRLFLTTEPHPAFPIGLLQCSMKVTNEPPAGLRAGMLHNYSAFVDQEKLERVDTPQWRALLFGLCFLHSIIMERRKFGALGWCIPYEFNASDLGACSTFLEKHLYSQQISWPTLQYIVSEVQYGGKITDDMDRRLFSTYAEAWLTPSTLAPNFTFNPSTIVGKMPKDFVYSIPDGMEIDIYRQYLSTYPEVDSPEIFGLHPNADMTYRTKEVNELLDTLLETQPKSATAGEGGKTREEVVMEKAKELLDKLPSAYVPDVYTTQIKKLGGLDIPLNVFLFQEVQRLQIIISIVRQTLSVLMQAIRGEVVMTARLLESMNAIFDARVPPTWVCTPSGNELSWLSPNLGVWFGSLIDRNGQLSEWLSKGRPSSFSITCFFNPQGFLTAMKQEVTRAHVADRWSLDDVVLHTEVTEFAGSTNVKKAPSEGVYIHGLFLDGCSWNKQDNTVVESEPKKLFAALPVLYVTAVTASQKKGSSGEYGPYGPYCCPLYKYPRRTDLHLICIVEIPTREFRPQHWQLRGAALLCSTE